MYFLIRLDLFNLTDPDAIESAQYTIPLGTLDAEDSQDHPNPNPVGVTPIPVQGDQMVKAGFNGGSLVTVLRRTFVVEESTVVLSCVDTELNRRHMTQQAAQTAAQMRAAQQLVDYQKEQREARRSGSKIITPGGK